MSIDVKNITVHKVINRVNRLRLKIDLLVKQQTFEFYPFQLLSEDQSKTLEKECVKILHIESIRLNNSVESGRGLPRYQEEIIANGQFNSICPVCGKNSQLEKSYPIFLEGYDLPIFYRFNCCFEFYLISAKSPARILGIYIPEKRIVISFENYKAYSHNLINYGLKTFLRWIHELERLKKVYTVQDQQQPALHGKSLVLVGFLQNFGHHLTDEIGGMSHLNLTDFARLKFLLGPNDWFGLKNIFNTSMEDYDESLKNNYVDLIDRVFLDVIKLGGCVIRITSNLPLSNAISEKLMNISKIQLSRDKKNLLSEIKGIPVVWVTLRSHYRRWDSQVDGLSKLINMLHPYLPNMTIVFDGFGNELESYEQIKSQLNPNIKIHSVIGFSISDTIPFASVCDFFIAPLGAGDVITSIPNIPGILHTHSEWAKRKLIVPSPREDGVSCIVVGGEITSGKDVFDFNYEISVQELFESVMKLSKSLGFHTNLDFEDS